MEELEAALAGSPDEATARRYMAAARDAGRRDAAVAFLRDLYRRTRHPGIWEAARGTFTAPELDGLEPPEAVEAGPEKEPLLPRRPYREVVLSSFRAPVANASAVFLLVVSGPLVLGAVLAMRVLGCLGLGIAVFLLGYLFGFLFDIVRQAAQGHARGPRLLTLIWSEESRFVFVTHFLNWTGAAFAAFWPAVVLGGAYRDAWPVAALSFLLTALHPVTILLAAFGNGFSSFNYSRAFDLLRRLGADYWRCAGVFWATTAAGIGVQWGASAWAGGEFERLSAVWLVAGWSMFASWAVQMRAVGLLGWARADAR